MTNIADEVLEELSKEKNRTLRRIDRAAAPGFSKDFDSELDEILHAVSDAVGCQTVLLSRDVPEAIWGGVWDVDENEESITEHAVALGLGNAVLRLVAIEKGRLYWRRIDREFLRTVATQLSTLFQAHLERARSRWLDALESEFFELDLHPGACFEVLTSRLQFIFPPVRLFPACSDELIQLLLLSDLNPSMLLIAASTGPEVGTWVGRNDSVSGLVFRETNDGATPEPILGDPGIPPLSDVYKGFSKNIRSEMVVPLTRNGRTVAALNLESSDEQAYLIGHLSYLLQVAPRLSLMVDALRSQIDSDERSRYGLASAQSRYWESVGRILKHDLLVPNTTLGLALQEMRNCAAEAVTQLELTKSGHTSESVLQNLNQIIQDCEDGLGSVEEGKSLLQRFGAQFTDYLHFENLDALDLLQDAIRFARAGLRADASGGRVRIDDPNILAEGPCLVHASPLLKVFIYNVFENSFYWIRQELSSRGQNFRPGGRVSVVIDEWDADDSPVALLNRFLRIVIEDDGPGAPPEVITLLNDSVPRTVSRREGGDGYALQAFRDYVQSIDGKVEFSSVLGQGFRVAIYLRLAAQNRREAE